MNQKILQGLSLAGIVLATGLATAAPTELVVYRCTDARGAVSLRDTPCVRGQQQQARDMLMPKDPPPRAAQIETPPLAPTPNAAPPAQVIVLQPPRPMFECVAPDGERYTSDTGLGRQRWEAVWVQHPAYPLDHRHDGPQRPQPVDSAWVEYRGDQLQGRIDLGRRASPWHWPAAPVIAGTWVRDPCYPLPQAEACDRLRDRRYDLDRQYNSALQSERTNITLEQRGIDARLTNDCRGF